MPKLCRNGPSCYYLKRGICWFLHPKEQPEQHNVQPQEAISQASTTVIDFSDPTNSQDSPEISNTQEDQNNKFSFFVKASNEKTKIVSDLNMNNFVRDIYKSLGTSEQNCRFTYNGKILNASQKLSHYPMFSGCTITQFVPCVGGGFQFNSLKNKIETKLCKISSNSDTAVTITITQEQKKLKDLSYYRSGLLLKANCQNKQCLAQKNKKQIWLKLGFGIFYVEREINNSKCPICQEKVRPTNIGFNDCQICFEGRRERENENVTWNQSAGELTLVTYQDDDQNLERWQYLILTVTRRNK